jgi:hypothetical protein
MFFFFFYATLTALADADLNQQTASIAHDNTTQLSIHLIRYHNDDYGNGQGKPEKSTGPPSPASASSSDMMTAMAASSLPSEGATCCCEEEEGPLGGEVEI